MSDYPRDHLNTGIERIHLDAITGSMGAAALLVAAQSPTAKTRSEKPISIVHVKASLQHPTDATKIATVLVQILRHDDDEDREVESFVVTSYEGEKCYKLKNVNNRPPPALAGAGVNNDLYYKVTVIGQDATAWKTRLTIHYAR